MRGSTRRNVRMTVRIGANPIGWSNDDLRSLGGDIPLERCLAEAREAGFAGTELGHKFPREPGALRAVLGAHGLHLVSGWHSGALLARSVEDEMAALRPHLDLLKALGANVLVFAETTGAVHGDQAAPLSRRPVLDEADWARLAPALTAVAERTQADGVRLVYHHHLGTVIETEAEIDRLMQATGEAVHLLLDTGHATAGGADPAALARRWRPRISHVHAKDVRPEILKRAREKDLSFLDAVVAGLFTVPGDGCVDYRAVFAELSGYSGWVVVEAEQDPEKADPLTYARMGYANLRGHLDRAGLV